jgi:hypothetical protein
VSKKRGEVKRADGSSMRRISIYLTPELYKATKIHVAGLDANLSEWVAGLIEREVVSEQKVLAAMSESGGPMSHHSIVRATGCYPGRVTAALRRLVDDGRVIPVTTYHGRKYEVAP